MQSLGQKARKILIILLCLIMVFGITAQAATISQKIKDKQKKLNDVKAEIAEMKEDLTERDLEALEAKETVYDMDLQMAQFEEKIAANSDILSQMDFNLEGAQEELNEIEGDVDVFQDGMEERLRAIYMHSFYQDIEYLFESESLIDFINRIETIGRIYDYDNENMDRLKVLKVMAEDREEDLTEKRKLYASIEDELLIEKQSMEILREEHQVALEQLNEEVAFYENKLDKDAAASKKLSIEIKRLQRDLAARKAAQKAASARKSSSSYSAAAVDIKYTGGKLAWPVPGSGRITSSYGYRRHPVTGGYRMHTGIDIGAKHGSTIVAAEDGVVIYAGYRSGYGYTIIIDHGGGLTTLYAHSSTLISKKGAVVERGQKIAKIGSTGTATGPHLHFEVRVSGNHKNPIGYLK